MASPGATLKAEDAPLKAKREAPPPNPNFFAMRSASTCEVCTTAKPVVYCRADDAYMCRACDLSIHSANKVARRHARQYLCEGCECRPAHVFCKQDGVLLCERCDHEIHGANVLASRHTRVIVDPFTQESLDAKAREKAAEAGHSLLPASAATSGVVPSMSEAASGSEQGQHLPKANTPEQISVDNAASPTLVNYYASSTPHHHLQQQQQQQQRPSTYAHTPPDNALPPHAVTAPTPFGPGGVAASASYVELEEHRRATDELFADMLATNGSGSFEPNALGDINALGNDDVLPPLFFEALGGTTLIPETNDAGYNGLRVELPPHAAAVPSNAIRNYHVANYGPVPPHQHDALPMRGEHATRSGEDTSAGDALVPFDMYGVEPAAREHAPPVAPPTGRASFGEWYAWAKKAEQNVPDPGAAMMPLAEAGAAGATAAPAPMASGKETGSRGVLDGMMPRMSLITSSRKEKVARYIEKRRRRVFEKTVRYVSRKAYAESRPRIKGRFARRDEIAPDGTILPSVLFREGLITEEELKLMEEVAREKHGTMDNGKVRTGRTITPDALPMNLPRRRGTTLPGLPVAKEAGAGGADEAKGDGAAQHS